MTAPEPTWTVADDYDGDPTLWYGDVAILRQFELESHGLRRAELPIDSLWSVLTRVLAPDEATIERLAEVIHECDISPYGIEEARAVLIVLSGGTSEPRPARTPTTRR